MTQILCLVLSMLAACSSEPEPTPEPRPAQMPASIVTTPVPNWQIARYFATNRDQYFKALPLRDFEVSKEWGTRYFSRLAERRAAAVAWSLEHHPTIIGIGVVHTVPGEKADVKKIVQIRKDAFDLIKVNAIDKPIFAYEERCDVAPVTWHINIVATAVTWQMVSGQQVPFDQIEADIIKDSPQSRALRELSDKLYPICGEEWPYHLMGALIIQAEPKLFQGGLPEGDLRTQMHFELKDRLIILRSEIALIRTIEAMQDTGKTTAIVSMGAYHIQDMRAAASEYGLTFEAHFPEGKEPDPRPSYTW